MKSKNSFVLLGIIIAAVLIFLLFWFSQPVRDSGVTVNQLDAINTQLKNRSTYSQLPVTFSTGQVGKDNPFQ